MRARGCLIQSRARIIILVANSTGCELSQVCRRFLGGAPVFPSNSLSLCTHARAQANRACTDRPATHTMLSKVVRVSSTLHANLSSAASESAVEGDIHGGCIQKPRIHSAAAFIYLKFSFRAAGPQRHKKLAVRATSLDMNFFLHK